MAVRIGFAGANPRPEMVPFERLDTKISYLIGNDEDKWYPAVPVWGGVRYVGLYPGIDLVAGEANGRLSLRLDARPGADLSRVALRVEGADGIAVDGNYLRIDTAVGAAALPLLVAEGAPAPATPRRLSGGVLELAAPFASNPAGPDAAEP